MVIEYNRLKPYFAACSKGHLMNICCQSKHTRGLFQLIKRILLKMGAEYVVTNKKVILKSGILNRDALELVLNKCEGIRINQSLMGRMLGFGSIVVTTGGVTNKFDFITNPIKFRNEINAQIQ
jgi:uncharacterized membrane protein YdbT with pleckstrin-like domain